MEAWTLIRKLVILKKSAGDLYSGGYRGVVTHRWI